MSIEMIEDSVKRLFAREVDKGLIERAEQGEFASHLWDRIVESGFNRILSAESHGGIEADWETAYPVFHQIGYQQAPVPLAETIIANFILSAAGHGVDDDSPLAILDEAAASGLTLFHDDASGFRLTGEARSGKWVRWCSHVLLHVPSSGFVLVRRDASGMTLSQGKDISGMPADDIRFQDTAVERVFANPFADLPEPVRTLGAAAKSAMMVGALEFALEQSVQYAKDRVQFGRPIGKNQAIQQQLAVMAGQVVTTRSAAYVAFRDLPHAGNLESPRAEFSVAAAKVCAGEAVRQGTSIAHQVHGAIGFTYEHSLNFATRRLWTWRGEFGNAAWWAERLGRAFVTAGADRFWENLTDRTMPTA